MKSNHLIIFVKNKILGKTKTRLAAGIGPQKAMEVYELLLQHTHLTTRCLPCKKNVYFSEELEQHGLWDDGNFSLVVQQGKSLGERMQYAFDQQFAQGAERVCIIGSDTFEISPALIQQAFSILETKDVVMGPANDGGYYLLGMNELQPEFFQNKAWSTESVLTQTLEDVKRLQLTYDLLPTLSDIDYKEDWLAYQKKIKQPLHENK